MENMYRKLLCKHFTYNNKLCTISIPESTPYFTPVFGDKPTEIVGIKICMDSWVFNPILGNCPSWTTAVKKVFVN